METSSGLPQKSSPIFGNLRISSEIFGNCQKMFENVCLALGTISGNLRKSSENHQKRRHQYVNIIKRTLHVSSKIWILCSHGKNNISLTRCTHPWDIVLTTPKQFVSSHHHVISPIYFTSIRNSSGHHGVICSIRITCKKDESITSTWQTLTFSSSHWSVTFCCSKKLVNKIMKIHFIETKMLQKKQCPMFSKSSYY